MVRQVIRWFRPLILEVETTMKCFLCTRKFLLTCATEKELIIGIHKTTNDFYDIDELRSRWQKMVAKEETVRLTLDIWPGWPNNDLVWSQLCNFVKVISSQIRSFGTTLSCDVGDDRWAILLQQLPPSLQKLSITIVQETQLAFQQIGQSLSKLQTLVVSHADGCPVYLPRERLPGLISSLPRLRKLTLWSLPEVSYALSWKELVCAIQSREQLEEANIFEGYALYGRIKSPLSEEEMEEIQFRPRLNEAKRAASNGVLPQSLDEFVSSLAVVHDRVDCLHYFFSTVDPNLYAAAAIASLTSRKQEKDEHSEQ